MKSIFKTLNKFFSNEFISRLDDVIYFNDISEDMIKKYCEKNDVKMNLNDLLLNSDYKRYGFRSINNYLKKHKNKTS